MLLLDLLLLLRSLRTPVASFSVEKLCAIWYSTFRYPGRCDRVLHKSQMANHHLFLKHLALATTNVSLVAGFIRTDTFSWRHCVSTSLSSPLISLHHRLCDKNAPPSSSPTRKCHFRRNHGSISQLLMSQGVPDPVAVGSTPSVCDPQQMIPFLSRSRQNSRWSIKGGSAVTASIRRWRKTGQGKRSMYGWWRWVN